MIVCVCVCVCVHVWIISENVWVSKCVGTCLGDCVDASMCVHASISSAKREIQ